MSLIVGNMLMLSFIFTLSQCIPFMSSLFYVLEIFKVSPRILSI